MNDRRTWIIVTDLDGSLLNHFDYSFEQALPTLTYLQKKNIPVIFNTSKTWHETRTLQKQLNLLAPFVVENGSCLYLPKRFFDVVPSQYAYSREDFWAIKLGKSLAEINRLLDKTTNDQDKLIKLTECTPAQASELTGLTQEQARAAMQREFSQPVIWQGDDEGLVDFKKRLKKQGLNTLQGGRFLHIQGITDKGLAIEKIKTFYGNNVGSIVLGDSANDLAMLNKADIPVVVKSPGNQYLLSEQAFPFITSKEAPAGWQEGIEFALEKII